MTKEPIPHPCCDYSFFLFSKLHDWIVKSELDYDLLYELQCREFGKYCDSEFNDPEVPENECIIKYLYSITPQ